MKRTFFAASLRHAGKIIIRWHTKAEISSLRITLLLFIVACLLCPEVQNHKRYHILSKLAYKTLANCTRENDFNCCCYKENVIWPTLVTVTRKQGGGQWCGSGSVSFSPPGSASMIQIREAKNQAKLWETRINIDKNLQKSIFLWIEITLLFSAHK